MLCPVCGSYADEDDIVCPSCGKLLERKLSEEEELMNFRQGRHLREEQLPPAPSPAPGSTGASRSFEDTRPHRPLNPDSVNWDMASGSSYYGEETDLARATTHGDRATLMHVSTRNSRARRHMSHRRMVNWAHVIVACLVLAMLGAFGVYLYLTQTPGGQVMMARMGQDATASALWQVGQEYQETGDVERAIEYFTRAWEKDEEAKEPNPTGLNMLGSAYEAVGNLEKAEEVYAYVYTEVVPSDVEAYRNQVRVLIAQGKEAQAAELLETAYAQTKLDTFRSQRLEILPSVPSASVIAGYYTNKQTVSILQAQEHQVLYTLDPFAVLPEDGILFEAPLELGEGEHELRAVAVNGDLVSDEMEATYQIYLPTPLAPDANLAPNTYKTARRVTLKPGKLSDEELEKNPGYAATLEDPVAQTVTIYYTIDGSLPDADSPLYTGDPILMNTPGYMTLRAVSVNGYGKQGNTKEVRIKLDMRGKSPQVFKVADTVGKLKLAGTTREDFIAEHGSGQKMETLWIELLGAECEKYTYDWGYALFMKNKSGWVLAELYFTTKRFEGPRGTGIGMAEAEVTAKFKDYGQVASPSGNRGLYEDLDNNDKGKIYKLDDGSKVIRYRTDTADAHILQLDYEVSTAGLVTGIRWSYEP